MGDVLEEAAARRSRGWPEWRVRLFVAWEVARSMRPLVAARMRRRRRGGAVQPRRREVRMDAWRQDVRYAVRSLRRTPGLVAVAVLTLALGVGASTTVFAVVDNVVLNPFPFPEPDRLVGVGQAFPKLDRELSFWEVLSPAEYLDLRAQSETLEGVVAWDMGNRAVTAGDRTENLFSAFWWGDAFPTLAMRPALGRGFLAEEVEGGHAVAILSHRVWSTWFGADRALLGEAVLVNGVPHTLVGVMPPGALIYGTDLWLPMPVGPEVFPRERRQFQVLARLAPGATLESAREELALIAGRTEAEHVAAHPEYEGWAVVPMRWKDINVRALRPAALALLGAIGFVLLLVCANVASVLVARASGRQREMAVRSALGAGRRRILRQLLTESLLLSLAGAAAGLAVTHVGVGVIRDTLTSLSLPVPGDIHVDARVLGFALLAGLGTGLLFGLAPALYAAGTDVRGMLQAESHGAGGGHRRLRLQRALVSVEVALAIVLLVGGGLLIHSFVRLQAVAPGFETSNLLTMRLTLAHERYDPDAIQPFLRELTRRLEEDPAIRGAATATQFPPLAFLRSRFWIEGREPGDETTLPLAFITVASPGYFELLGIPVLSGRAFGAGDDPGSHRVAVINEAAARRYFPGEDPVGRRLKLGSSESDRPWFEVIGVVASTRNEGAEAPPAPELFASSEQLAGDTGNQHFLLVGTAGSARAALPAIREAVASLDPQQPVYAIRTVDEAFAGRTLQRRVATTAISAFGLFALLLATVGIYAVVSFAVTQRTREIGVRMALGADRGRVRALVVRQAFPPVLVGGLVGLAGALAAGRLLSGLLFEVGAIDPWTLAGVALVFGAMTALASYLPARRASGLDPVVALREEVRP